MHNKREKTAKRVFTFRTKAVMFSVVFSMLIFIFVILIFINIYNQCTTSTYDKLRANAQRAAVEVDRMVKTLDSFTLAQFTSQSISEIISAPLPSQRNSLINILNQEESESASDYNFAMRNMAGRLISSYFFTDPEHYHIFPFSYVHSRQQENQAIFRKSAQINRSSPLFFPPSLANSYFFYVRTVDNLPVSKTSGTIIQCMSAEEFSVIATNTSDDVKITISDRSGAIYGIDDWTQVGSIHPMAEVYEKQKGVHDEFENIQEDTIYLIEQCASGRLLVICSSSRHALINQIWEQMFPYIIIAALFIIILNISIWIVSTNIVRLMNRLLRRIVQLQDGDYSVRMPAYRDRDFAVISDGFNGMAEKLQYMITVVHKEEVLRKETELKFLQAQINPHFLFNVLTTIRVKAKLNGDEPVYKMLYSLGELIHAGIVRDDHALIPLREELHYVVQYLSLQAMRYEDKLTYAVNVENPAYLECRIPRLSIESIVENGIIHGLENKLGRGSLTVDIHKADDDLEILIKDDGVGFDVNRVKNEAPGTIHSGIGLNNADQRIKLLFGEAYGLSIQSEIDKGTCVCVRIPISEEIKHA